MEREGIGGRQSAELNFPSSPPIFIFEPTNVNIYIPICQISMAAEMHGWRQEEKEMRETIHHAQKLK